MSTTQKFSECIFYQRGNCGTFYSKKGDIQQELVSLSMLNGAIDQHSLHIGVDLSSFTERSLIMNRMGVSDICDDNDIVRAMSAESDIVPGNSSSFSPSSIFCCDSCSLYIYMMLLEKDIEINSKASISSSLMHRNNMATLDKKRNYAIGN